MISASGCKRIYSLPPAYPYDDFETPPCCSSATSWLIFTLGIGGATKLQLADWSRISGVSRPREPDGDVEEGTSGGGERVPQRSSRSFHVLQQVSRGGKRFSAVVMGSSNREVRSCLCCFLFVVLTVVVAHVAVGVVGVVAGVSVVIVVGFLLVCYNAKVSNAQFFFTSTHCPEASPRALGRIRSRYSHGAQVVTSING